MVMGGGVIVDDSVLPFHYGISAAGKLGIPLFLTRLERALSWGLRLVQIREPDLGQEQLRELVSEAVLRSHACGARVLVSGDPDVAMACGADGVHWPSRFLDGRFLRVEGLSLFGASCHSATELDGARVACVDFVVLGPVLATESHPGEPVLGWDRFADLLKGYGVPVFALGGMDFTSLGEARKSGAHGVAMLRSAWMEYGICGPSG